MKFPLRLSVDMLRNKVSRAFAGDRGAATIMRLSPAAFSAPSQKEIDAESDPQAALMEIPAHLASQMSAPVLWISGEEPLSNPVIGRIAAALNAAGRNVFLHTNGARLRQRIHEFRPDARLFLTVELAGREEIHDKITGESGLFRRVIEGIRAAKLSGFHVCTHVTVGPQTDACETGELFDSLDRYDVDGFIVSSGGRVAEAAHPAGTLEKLNEIRSLVRCGRWEKFSELLEASYETPHEIEKMIPARASEAGSCEERA